jgi:hypothetical protein
MWSPFGKPPLFHDQSSPSNGRTSAAAAPAWHWGRVGAAQPALLAARTSAVTLTASCRPVRERIVCLTALWSHAFGVAAR